MARTRAAVVTVSTASRRRARTGPATPPTCCSGTRASTIRSAGVVPDERGDIEAALRELAADHDLVVTTGGTGFGPRDVTPEATRAAIDREAPGLAELMSDTGSRIRRWRRCPRAVAGSVGETPILNLPGSPKGSASRSARCGRRSRTRSSSWAGARRASHRACRRRRHGAVTTAVGTPDPSPAAGWVEAKAVRAIGAPPCEVGNAMSTVPEEVEPRCAEFDAAAVERGPPIRATGRPEVRTFHHEQGDVEVYLEPHAPPPRLVVVSATDVARRCSVRWSDKGVPSCCSSEDGAASDDPPAAASLAEIAPGPRTRWCSRTTTRRIGDMLAMLLRSPVAFIGAVMGSRRHVAHYVEDLRSRGFADEDLARIRSPLGLDLGGRRPEEIALDRRRPRRGSARFEGGWLDR